MTKACKHSGGLSTLILLSTLPAVSAFGDASWNNPGSGDWQDVSNWDVDFPDLSTWALIDNGGEAILGSGSAEAMQLRVGNANDGTLVIAGGSLTVADDVEIARLDGSAGLLDLRSGSLTVNNRLWVSGIGGDGQFLMSGGSLLVDGPTGIQVGNGLFAQVGGTIERRPNGATTDIEVGTAGAYEMSGTARATLGSVFAHGGDVTLSDDAWLTAFSQVQVSQGAILTLQDNATIDYGSVKVGGAIGNATYIQTGGQFIGTRLSVGGNLGTQYLAQITGGTIDVDHVNVGTSATMDKDDILEVSNVDIHAIFNVESDASTGYVHSATFNATDANLSGSLTVQSDRGTAVARQIGGTAVWEDLRIYGQVFAGSPQNKSTYIIDGAHVNVVEKLTGDNPLYYAGTIDFNGSSGELRFNNDAYADLTSLTFANQGNASLILGDEMLVRVSPGTVVGEGFGSYTPNGAVIYEAGSDLVIEQGESVRLRSDLRIEENVVVRGLLRDRYRNGLRLDGGLEINGGLVRLEDRGSILADETSGGITVSGGGVLQVRDVEARQTQGNTAFVLDGGIVDIARNFVITGGSLLVEDGDFYARYFDREYLSGDHGRVVQNGGSVRAEQLRTSEYTLNDGELITGTTSLHGGPDIFTQYGGLHRTSKLNIGVLQSGVYRYYGGELELHDGVFGIGSQGTLDLGGQELTVQINSGVFLASAHGSAIANAQNGTLALDEHSLLLVQPGTSVNFGTIQNAGLAWDNVSDLTIPVGRDIVMVSQNSLSGRLDIQGTVRGIEGTRVDNFELNGGTLDLSSEGSVVNVVNGNPVLNSGSLIGSIRVATRSPRSFLQNGGVVEGSVAVTQDSGNAYHLNGGSLNIQGLADFRYATSLANDGTPAQLVAKGGSHVDFFSGMTPGSVAGVDLVVEENALVTFAAGTDYNAEFASVTNNGLIHLDGTELFVPEGVSVTPRQRIDGDVTLNGTLIVKPGNVVYINGALSFGQQALMDIGLAWNESSHELYRSEVRFTVDPPQTFQLNGGLQVSLDSQVYLDGDEELFILEANFMEGAFNGGAERVFTTGGEGSFLIDYREGDGVYLTNYLPYRPFDGDLNRDRTVDQEDFNLVVSNYSTSVQPGDNFAGDWNGDGAVDAKDLHTVTGGWTGVAPPMVGELVSPYLLGDLNNSGIADTQDFYFFVQALRYRSDFEQGLGLYPDFAGDLDNNGVFDGRDLHQAANTFTSPGSESSLDRPSNYVAIDLAFDQMDNGSADGSQVNAFATVLATGKVYVYGDSRGDVAGLSGPDGVIDAIDIDAMFSLLGSGAGADMDGDRDTDRDDIADLVQNILGTNFGDANLDGEIDDEDLHTVLNSYGTVTGWAGGDFNGDGVADFFDLTVAIRNFTATESTLINIPEPSSAILFGAAVLGALGHRRSRF